MFVKNEECKITPCEPGVTRKVMSYCDELMMCEITCEKGIPTAILTFRLRILPKEFSSSPSTVRLRW